MGRAVTEALDAMIPSTVTFAELEQKLGTLTCGAYALATRDKSMRWLEERRLDPESVLILNLERRSAETENDKIKPTWLYLGGDGCGNYYFVDGSSKKPRVLLDAHDPPGIEDPNLTIAQFVRGKEIELPAQNYVGKGELIISKTEQIHRSVLLPIAVDEWARALSRHKEFEYPAYRIGMNPFTNEEMRFQAPGGAVLCLT